MSFVPIVTSTSVQPSPQVRELSQKLTELIREYERDHPGISPAEIHQALQLARPRGGAPAATVAVAAGLLALVLGGIVAFLLASGRTVPPVALAVGVAGLLAVGLMAFLVSRR